MTAALLLALLGATGPVRIGSKDFGESRLLGELFAQTIEAQGVPVSRKLGLSGSSVAFNALEADELDAYPEYTGTAFQLLLHEPLPSTRVESTLEAALAQLGLLWLPSLGFSNGWVIAVPKAIAAREHLATLSDLVRVAPTLKAGFSPEFLGRDDGLPGLERRYGFHFRETLPMAQPLKYEAISSGEIQLLDAYATDGRLATAALTALADDQNFFPPYQAAPICRSDLFARSPEAAAALLSLRGRLSESEMRRLNAEVEAGRSPADVARDWLETQGLTAAATGVRAPEKASSLWGYFWAKRGELWRLLRRHLALTAGALSLAAVVGFPLGIAAARSRPLRQLVLQTVGVGQTIPGLALLAFLVPWLGIGPWPALVALFVYALLPIVQATLAGLTSIDPILIDVAVGLGMTESQIARQLRGPLAIRVAMSGFRTAAVIAVGTATLAAFVGGGGLGEPIVAGLALNDPRLILFGAIPSALLAILLDAALGALSHAVEPRL